MCRIADIELVQYAREFLIVAHQLHFYFILCRNISNDSIFSFIPAGRVY